MQRLGSGIEYRILPEGGSTIIGSSDKNTTGELYASNVIFKIASPMNRRNKRVLDIFLCFLFLILSPLIVIALRFNFTVFKNIIPVVLGQKTWVGYYENTDIHLPKIKQGVFSPLIQKDILSESTLQKMNYFYAKDYDVWHDVTLVWAALRSF
jgi:O-antigen biosynthesis protein